MRSIVAVLLLALVGVSSARAQTTPADPAPFLSRGELAIGYNNVLANAPPGSCGCFDMNGGFASASIALSHWLSAAAEITGGHASRIGPYGQDLSLTTYAFGPRISFRSRHAVPFAQILFGVAHGADSYFPTSTGYSSSATGFAFSTGGGLDIPLSHHVAARPIEIQYLRTALPNGSGGYQNHLMLGIGVVVRFGHS